MDPPPPEPVEPRLGPPEPPPAMPPEPNGVRPARRPRRLLALVLVTAVVLLGGGAAAAFFTLRGSDEEILALVPASSDVVVTAYLDPSAGQKMNLLALAHRFPALANDQALRSRVNDTLDEMLADAGLDHTDLQGWLGPQAAVAVDFDPDSGATSWAVMVASADDGLAAATIEKAVGEIGGELQRRDYRGVTLSFTDESAFAIVDHVAVMAEDPAVINRTIDTARGTIPNVAEDATFERTISALPAGKLGLVYVNPADFVNELEATPFGGGAQPGFETLRAMRGIGLSLSAQPDGIALDMTIRYDPLKLDPATRQQMDAPAHENAMLSFAPGDSFAVIGEENIDDSLKQVVDQALSTPEGERIRSRLGLDATISSLTGDVALEVGRGTAAVPAGGAVAIGVTDPAPVQQTLDGLADLVIAAQGPGGFPAGTGVKLPTRQQRQLGTLLEQPRPAWKTTTYQGTTIRYLQEPSLASSGVLPAYAVVDGAAIIASNPAEIRKMIDTKAAGSDVTTSESYMRALRRVPSGATTVYVDVAGIVSEVGAALPPDVRENLAPVKTVVSGSEDSSSVTTSRVFVEIR
jgi:hypothetical protein